MSVKPTLLELILNATAAGKSMLTAANAAAQKTLLSLVKGDVGLGNVDNTSDANKPVSTAQQTALDAKQNTLVSGTNIKTVNSSSLLGSGDLAISGLSGTGSVDNAALRADGTGGATLQSSAWIINDNLTASPNNTINHACIEATGATTNVSVSIKPKGTGAFCLSAPDGTATGGNVRGANAIDLQTLRTAANQVASAYSSIVIGVANTASGQASTAIGRLTIASGDGSVVIGDQITATANYAVSIGGQGTSASGAAAVAMGGGTASAQSAVAIGLLNTASAAYSYCFGVYGTANRYNQFSHGGGFPAGLISGASQYVRFVLGNKTTNATPTTLFLNGTSASVRLTITSGTIMFADVTILGIKSDGSAAACYRRKVAVKNVGGTTSLVGSVETIGTDIEDNVATDVAITADNTNDALQINVTGIAAETWRWLAIVDGAELVYGT